MFNACLRPEYAYYRLVKATVGFQKVCCVDKAVYTLPRIQSGRTITDRGADAAGMMSAALMCEELAR